MAKLGDRNLILSWVSSKVTSSHLLLIGCDVGEGGLTRTGTFDTFHLLEYFATGSRPLLTTVESKVSFVYM